MIAARSAFVMFRMASVLTLCAGTALAAPLASPTSTQAAGFDPASGRDTRHYPPHRHADFLHLRAAIDIPDMNNPVFTGTETLSFKGLGEELTSLDLDARAMRVSKVEYAGKPATFTLDNDRLSITLDPPVAPGAESAVTITYQVSDPPFGLMWFPESASMPGRAAQLHTQGETETNSYWIPGHDYPDDRLSSELIVTVPAGYQVCANGRLVAHDKTIRTIDSAGRVEMQPAEVFHWFQEQPHAFYLISMVVGKFDVTDVSTSALPMPIYSPPGTAADARATFARTPEMIAFFSSILDEPYPWDKYAQACVWNFGWGGMENTSCTTLWDGALVPAADLPFHSQEGLISHELGHQWFGDLLTCHGWENIWLNEGFATYMSQLWEEHARGRDAYLAGIRGNFDGIIGGDHANAPEAVGMVSNVYEESWDVFSKPANPYGKGSSILHMLRVKLGDGPFFAGIRKYIDDHKFTMVENDEFRRSLEAASGENLEQFFTQWTLRPGVPHADIKLEWDAGAGSLRVSLTQTQKIDGDNPAFEFDLPILAADGEGKFTRTVLNVRGSSAQATLPLSGEPAFVAVDPDLAVLGHWNISQSEAAWQRQLAAGPTLPARIQAARGLKAAGASLAAEQLRSLVQRQTEPVALRRECVVALAARGSDGDLRALPGSLTDAHEVREAVTNALADVALAERNAQNPEFTDGVVDQLASIAEKDASVSVRAAAIRSLGRLKAGGRLVREALQTPSYADTLCQAALDALGNYDSPEALRLVVAHTKPGFEGRTRATALGKLPGLAGNGRPAAIEAAVAALADRDDRVRRAAGDALAELGGPEALAALRKNLDASRAPVWSRRVQAWITSAEAKSK